MLSLAPLFDAFALGLDSTSYDERRRRMEAQITFTLPLEEYESETHDVLARGFDDVENDDWKIELLEIDQGKDVAWFSFLIEARSQPACAYLQDRTQTASFWFQTGSVEEDETSEEAVSTVPGRITTFVRMRRANMLLELMDRIEVHLDDPSSLNAQTFADCVMAIVSAGIDPREIAKAANVSIPTISRWSRGVSSPHPMMMPSAMKALASLVRETAVSGR